MASKGWIVFAWDNAFCYNRRQDGSTNWALHTRLADLYQLKLGQDNEIDHVAIIRGQIRFVSTRFNWLTDGLPSTIDYSADERYIVAVQGESTVLRSHGYILPAETRSYALPDDQQPRLSGKTLPAFIIREYPGGGQFVYACFSLRKLADFDRIFLNFWRHRYRREEPTDARKELWARILMAVFAIAFFLLLARDLIGGTWEAYLGGLIVGVIASVLATYLTGGLDRFLH